LGSGDAAIVVSEENMNDRTFATVRDEDDAFEEI
jgi:hypothetical protein